MFDPVRLLSPVIITQSISAAFNYLIAFIVYFFNLFSNTSKPLKIRPFSIYYRPNAFIYSSDIGLLAIANTLKPCDAYSFKI